MDARVKSIESKSQLQFETFVLKKITTLEEGIQSNLDELFGDIDSIISSKVEHLKLFNKEIIDQSFELMDKLNEEFKQIKHQIHSHISEQKLVDDQGKQINATDAMNRINDQMTLGFKEMEQRYDMLKHQVHLLSKEFMFNQRSNLQNELPKINQKDNKKF